MVTMRTGFNAKTQRSKGAKNYFPLCIFASLRLCVETFCLVMMLLLFHASSLSAQDVIVEASVDTGQRSLSPSISGTITITRPRAAEVDIHSFTLQGKPLAAEFVKDVKMDHADTLVSIYHFALSPKEKGLYVLDPVAVKIGGKLYQSPATTYQIDEHATAPAVGGGGGVIFQLESGVNGPHVLYPGQRTQLIYRISYNRSVGLTASELPLVHTNELRRIGDEQIKDFQQGELTIQEIVSEVEALKPGTFRYGPSFIEGYAYTLDAVGERVFDKRKLRAEAPVVELVVQPFPVSTQPASFNGALGKLTAQIKLLTPSKIDIGDAIQASITVSGLANLREFTLPELLCQPGFAGFFQMSDLPPAGHIDGDKKRFNVELRAVSSLTTALPPVQLSSFDPISQRYVVWYSEAIPLEVATSSENKPSLVPGKEIDWANLWRKADNSVAPLDRNGQEVDSSALSAPRQHLLDVLWIIPLGALVLLGQFYLKRQQDLRPKTTPPPTSILLLHEGLKEDADPKRAAKLLQAACLRRMAEKDLVAANDPLRSFIRELDIFQYAKDSAFSLLELKQRAKLLLGMFCLGLLTSANILAASEMNAVLDEANRAYREGEQATTAVQRLKAFNQALSLYSSVEKEGLTSSYLDEAIGNSFSQLGEFPWAILYYRRALVQEPHRAALHTALESAQMTLGIEPGISRPWSERLLSFDDRLSLQKRASLFFWFTAAAIAAASWWIWKRTSLAMQIAKAFCIVAAVLFLNLLLSYYRSPIEAILVSPTGLYRGPDNEQPQLLEKPMFAGNALEVVDVESEGRWLKVKTADGTIGYIPFQAARLI